MLSLKLLSRISALAFFLGLFLLLSVIIRDSRIERESSSFLIPPKQFGGYTLPLKPRTFACEVSVKRPALARVDVYILNLTGLQQWTHNGILNPLEGYTNITGANFQTQLSRAIYTILAYNPNDIPVEVSAVIFLGSEEWDLITASTILTVVATMQYLMVKILYRKVKA